MHGDFSPEVRSTLRSNACASRMKSLIEANLSRTRPRSPRRKISSLGSSGGAAAAKCAQIAWYSSAPCIVQSICRR